MEFIDLKSQQALIKEKINERIRVVLNHGSISWVQKFMN